MLLKHPMMHGFATVAISLALIVGASILTLYATKTAIAEQRVSHNEQRVKLAFEAADAGMNAAIMYLTENRANYLVDVDNDGFIDPLPADASGTLPNGTTYVVALTNPTANDFSVVTIISTGGSADGTVSRTVSQSFTNETILDGEPPTPFTVKGNIGISGNLYIENMHTNTSIWSGGAVTFGGSAESCNSTVCSNRRGKDADLAENDASLSAMTNDEFFQNFFGASKAAVKQGAQRKYTSSSNTNYSSVVDGVENKIIWIDQSGGGEARINSNVTIGSPEKPVVLIVQGDLHINGTATIYGVLYVDGDWHNSGGGTLDVQGSVIVNGDYSGTGTPNIQYDPYVLIKTATDIGYFSKVSGSWRDF